VNRALPAVVPVVLGLLLTSCGDEGTGETDEATESAAPSPSTDVELPDGVTLTAGGEDLGFGDSATVVFEPTQRVGSVLEMQVDKVSEGTLDDFAGFVLDSTVKSSTPYYVEVAVENVGEENVGGFAIPLYGVNETNTLLRASAFTTDFPRCESKALPAKFETDDAFETCLVYLTPDRGMLEAVSFRPTQQFDPITWTGEIEEPEPDKSESPKDQKNDN